MSNWKQYLEDEVKHTGSKKKVNKNIFCKKNKLGGGRFGQHLYENGSKSCKLCGHIRKDLNKEMINNE